LRRSSDAIFGKIGLTDAVLVSLPQVRVIAARKQGRATLLVSIQKETPKVDGKLDEWAEGTRWAQIGNDAAAAVMVSSDRLYAAYRTSEPRVLENDAANPLLAFKPGGCLDLVLGADPKADRNRPGPVAGDLRLLVTRSKGRPLATLYRAVAPGTPENARTLSGSPIGKVWFDKVEDVSDKLELAQVGGDVEFSIPLATLGLDAQESIIILGDLGVLKGNGVQTTQRLYWSNLYTYIVSDIPSEARLQPGNWGLWTFRRFSTIYREPDAAAQAALPGLHYELFKPPHNWGGNLPEFAKLQPTSQGNVDTFAFPDKAEHQPGFRFTGFIEVPKDGLHTFYLRADAEARLYIGNTKVVQGNRNENITYEGDILLKAGRHPIRVEYVNDFARATLQASWQGPGIPRQETPKAVLSHTP
jgi:hypothetical protein